MNILSRYISFEENIKGSRFLSELFPCESQTEARNLIKEQKSKYADSTHVVHAFIIGPNAEIMGMSDDGEPSGTAGRPALDVLKGKNCTNILLTVTRWFGGTLLGTGGLVKAYSSGAKNVFIEAETHSLLAPLIAKESFTFDTDYSFYKTAKKILENYSIFNLSESFETGVTLSGQIKADEKQNLISKILDMSNGKVIVK